MELVRFLQRLEFALLLAQSFPLIVELAVEVLAEGAVVEEGAAEVLAARAVARSTVDCLECCFAD
jgi:hypothetical protein